MEVTEKFIKLKWVADGSEEKVSPEDVRLKPEEVPEPEPNYDFIDIGTEVEGQTATIEGDDWFACTIRGIRADTVRVKWAFDGSEEQVAKCKLRPKPEPVPPPEPIRLIIEGGTERARMEMELRVMALVENKVEGHYSENLPEVTEGDGLGWGILPLIEDGEYKPKIIGKQGAMRKKICSTSGCYMEVLGKTACMVGLREERKRAQFLVDQIQTGAKEGGGDANQLRTLPEEFTSRCLLVRVPPDKDSQAAVLGAGRATLNAIEEETGVLAFFAAGTLALKILKASASQSGEITLGFEAGMEVEASERGTWKPAKVVGTYVDEDDDQMVTIRWEHDGKEVDFPPARVRPRLEGDAAEAQQARQDLSRAKLLAVLGGDSTSRKTAEIRIMDALVQATYKKHFALEAMKITKTNQTDEPSAINITSEEATKARGEPDRLKAAAVAAGCTTAGLVG